jgi:riboflavin synthase
MFTGIVEQMGEVVSSVQTGSNVELFIKAPFATELKIDQSVAHNGVCLTVVELFVDNHMYRVTAVDETLKRTNIGTLSQGDKINLERCTMLGARLDGHLVQGHVDQTAVLHHVDVLAGSWMLHFRFAEKPLHFMVPKGSVTVNGVSLTVVDALDNGFNVTIIPYTWEHTNLGQLQIGDSVNIEFDIVGKYIERMAKGWGAHNVAALGSL